VPIFTNHAKTVTIPPLKMCFGDREDPETKKSKDIDAMIRNDEKNMTKVVKLLLLGKLRPSKAWWLTKHALLLTKLSIIQVPEKAGSLRY